MKSGLSKKRNQLLKHQTRNPKNLHGSKITIILYGLQPWEKQILDQAVWRKEKAASPFGFTPEKTFMFYNLRFVTSNPGEQNF
mgnify:CR=1 FL=1